MEERSWLFSGGLLFGLTDIWFSLTDRSSRCSRGNFWSSQFRSKLRLPHRWSKSSATSRRFLRCKDKSTLSGGRRVMCEMKYQGTSVVLGRVRHAHVSPSQQGASVCCGSANQRKFVGGRGLSDEPALRKLCEAIEHESCLRFAKTLRNFVHRWRNPNLTRCPR